MKKLQNVLIVYFAIMTLLMLLLGNFMSVFSGIIALALAKKTQDGTIDGKWIIGLSIFYAVLRFVQIYNIGDVIDTISWSLLAYSFYKDE